MKQLAILSGKGGTGKTTIAGCFIRLAKNKSFADCDVDAPNLHLTFSKGELLAKNDYQGSKKAVKYDELCSNCGKCEELCKFHAIKNGVLDRLQCEGCGVCEYFCPQVSKDGKKAIRLKDNVSGETSVLNVSGEIFSTAILKMGNGASGKLVTTVRKNLHSKKTTEELIIIDGSPGIGCPVIASLTGVDIALIVTEPTVSGFSDMKRIIDTAKRFNTTVLVCINKFDVNILKTAEIEEFLVQTGISLAGKIPYDISASIAINKGITVVDLEESLAGREIKKVWDLVYMNLFKDVRYSL